MKRVRIEPHSLKYQFGIRFKELRKKKGLTQEKFSEVFPDATLDSVRSWEQHYAVPEISTLLDLCDFFGCDLDYLMGRIECMDHEKQYIHDKTLLSEKAIKAIQNNRRTVRTDPLTEEQIRKINEEAARIGAIWEPIEEYEVVDDRNIKFLNALIESEQFFALYQWYGIYADYLLSYENKKKAVQAINDEVYNWLTEEQKNKHLEDIKEMDSLKDKVEISKTRLTSIFGFFLSDQDPSK